MNRPTQRAATEPAPLDRAALDRMAAEWRYIITDMICRAGSGHLGGALSLVEILITLYHRVMRLDPSDPSWDGRDRLVLSKGHAAPALYLALASRGFFPMDWLKTLNADGTRLPSHADARHVPGVDATTGSLGQGLSFACGLAHAARLDGKSHRVFCIIGDGESDEGQIWEAAMFAGHHRLDSLVAITDYNRLQIDAHTDDLLTLEPLRDKWRAFGWEVFEMDGHDWDSILDTIAAAAATRGKPSMILAHTVKGKGCPLVENKPESHNIRVPDAETRDRYLDSIGVEVALPY